MGINENLQDNDVLVKIEFNWYRLDSVSVSDDKTMPIVVSDEDDNQFTHWDMADIDEIDPPVKSYSIDELIGVA